MLLPYDIARCPGNRSAICQHCRRREPGRDYYQTMIMPQADMETCVNFWPQDVNKAEHTEANNGASEKQCKSYRPPLIGICADGFPQCGYCVNGDIGVYSRPLCLGEDIPESRQSFFDEEGKPKLFGRMIHVSR